MIASFVVDSSRAFQSDNHTFHKWPFNENMRFNLKPKPKIAVNTELSDQNDPVAGKEGQRDRGSIHRGYG